MKKIVVILLFSLISLWGYCQMPLMLTGDTASSVLVEPPDTAEVFTVNVGGVDEPFSSLKTEIRSYWTLEEASGYAIDSVGTVDLWVFGSVGYEETGKIGNCYSFTASSYLGPIDTYFEFDGSFSVSCWINTTSTTSWDGIMTNFGASNYGWELLSVGNPERTIWWRLRYGNGDAVIQGTTDINDGTWHHIAASYSAVDDTMKLWVDGVPDATFIKNTNGVIYNSAARFLIGERLESSAYFEGKIDEPATWNREITQKEVDSLFAESQYPFAGQGSGGDSLNMTISGEDTRADTFRVNSKFASYPTSRTDGDLDFAFGIIDIADYYDTTFMYADLKDTTRYYTMWTGLIPEDTWTGVPNKDTVFIDSSDVTPPDQDIGIWDTIFYWDGEDHISLPKEYTSGYSAYHVPDGSENLWEPDWDPSNPSWGRNSDHRYGGWEFLRDSLVIDPITGSNVMKFNFKDTIINGWEGEGSHRGGDMWQTLLGGNYSEIYLSYNIMLRPGWDFAKGGKLGPGPIGGTGFEHGLGPEVPGYGQGFTAQPVWHWDPDVGGEDWYGMVYTYLYYQDMGGKYGDTKYWGQFQPVGDGELNYNSVGMYTHNFPELATDSVWYNITTRVVINTFDGSTQNYDGIIEGYVNGHLVGQWSGLYLITYPDRNLKMWNFTFTMFFGGGGGPTRDEWALIDDVYVFTYDESVDVPRGNELSSSGRVLSIPNHPKTSEYE